MLSVRLLGPVEVECDGERLPSLSSRTRTLLTALALEVGRVVSRDRLVDVVWGENPPESIGTQVAIQVSKLRKRMGATSIETVGRGYRLNAAIVQVDAAMAEQLLVRARDLQRPDLFREALQMWRGPVCDDVHSDAIVPAVQRLEELFLASVEEWAALQLDTGGEADVVTVVPELVARHPLRERLRAVLMEALWRDERRADALALYAEGRRLLADELGLDPGPELAGLQQQILQNDVVSAPAPAGTYSTIAVPRQLPADLHHIAGRDSEIKAVEAIIESAESGAVIALHGTGGVGKTTLTVHVGHRLVDQFPDGQVFLNLRGYGSHESTDTATALGALLHAFGLSESKIPDGEEARASSLRNLVAGRRVLVVLDNARDSMQVRPLLPGGSSVVLVTSRSQLRSLAAREGAHRIAIDSLTEDGAVQLLKSRGAGTQWEQPELLELAQLCGRLPVALSVAAERASRYPDRPLAELNAELRDGLGALDVLTAWEDDPHTSVRAVLTWSYEVLGEDEARMFLLLGLHPPQYYDRNVAASLAAVDLGAAGRLLDRLADAHLLGEPRPGVFEMHDLVYAYAVSSAADRLAASDRADAARRMRAYYTHTMDSGRDHFSAEKYPFDVGTLPVGLSVHAFDSEEGVRRWTVDNWSVVRQVVQDAITDQDHVAVHRLAALMALLGRDWGRLEELRELVELAAWHGRAGGVRSADAYRYDRLGMVAWRAGQLANALEFFERAYALCRELGDMRRAAFALTSQGLALSRLGHVEEAIECVEESLRQRVQLGMPTALTLNNLAVAYRTACRYADALAAADQALAMFRTAGSIWEQAVVLDTRGSVHAARGDHSEAVNDFGQAAALFADLGTILHTAIAMSHLGDEQLILGDLDAARASWSRALAIMTDLGASDSVHLARDELVQRIADVDASLATET